VKEKTLSGEIEELIHGNIPISGNEPLDKEYDDLKAEFSLPECGIEIETHKQKNTDQNTDSPVTKEYVQEKADLQKMAADDIIILRENGDDSEILENEDVTRIINFRKKH